MYSYSIRDISLNDEGKYECILFPKSVAAYLTVAGENSKVHSNSKYMLMLHFYEKRWTGADPGGARAPPLDPRF